MTYLHLTFLTLLFSCSSDQTQQSGTEGAEVTEVEISGNEGRYRFSTTLSTPDKGCDQYADWWEVLSENGELLYRRILAHSHVNEQPFTRSGGPVDISADQMVIIRGHMNNTGYGRQAMKGSVQNGFKEIELTEEFAAELATQEPLPNGCRF